MKGFFRWFNSKTKIKRWIVLILIGIILACYGMSKLLVEKQLGFQELAVIIISFVIGFTFVVIGMIYIQKRTLEILVQESDTRKEKTNGNVKSLIFNKKVYDEGPNIVVIGGGKGLDSVLKGLKNYTNNLTAIVTVSDYGETITDSRKELATLPLNDIKSSIVALSSNETMMKTFMDYQYPEGRLKSLCLGDIYLSGMNRILGDFSSAVQNCSEILNITGKVYPVTLDEMHICAELEDGTVVEKRENILNTVMDKVSKINRVFLQPHHCTPAPGVIEAIQKADAIIIGPGSLYTNVIPNLLVKGVAKAIKENSGFKIYISNLMTEPGQTDDYTLSDHIKAIEDHAGKGIIDYCIYDTGEIIPEFIRKYNQEGAELLEADTAKVKDMGIKLIQRNLSCVDGEKVRHDPEGIALAIIQLICEDMKFRDMQNDAQYVMLHERAKESKKQIKQKAKQESKTKPKTTKKKTAQKGSKFAEKYKDRIESIKESDKKIKKKNK